MVLKAEDFGMPVNADKPHLWRQDIQDSVDLFNRWFMLFAPKAYRDSRAITTEQVEESLRLTQDLRALTAEVLRNHPAVLPTLRMATCPPLARDRLIGLANLSKNLVLRMESGRLPIRMPIEQLESNLSQIAAIITRMLDVDIFPWIASGELPTAMERHRASTMVADRLCGAVSDPIVRNAQEKRQLANIGEYLQRKRYPQKAHPAGQPLTAMEPGTYTFRMNVVVGDTHKVNVPIDVVIQPKTPRSSRLPILIEAKSAGDFTNTNKRRKEEATKITQLRQTYGEDVEFILFLCGYFDGGYLGYEAMHGIDWIWEHRIEDLDHLGI
jgi:hypothetical protein